MIGNVMPFCNIYQTGRTAESAVFINASQLRRKDNHRHFCIFKAEPLFTESQSVTIYCAVSQDVSIEMATNAGSLNVDDKLPHRVFPGGLHYSALLNRNVLIASSKILAIWGE